MGPWIRRNTSARRRLGLLLPTLVVLLAGLILPGRARVAASLTTTHRASPRSRTPHEDPRRVLFDEAHGERNTLSWERAETLDPEHPENVYYGELDTALADAFSFERNADSALTSGLLQDYDALLLAAPEQPLDAAELEAVGQFLAGGGGLLVLGDCGLDGPLDVPTPGYGITLEPDCLLAPGPESDFALESFADHPATPPGSSLVTNWSGSLVVEDPALALAWTGENVWRDLDGDLNQGLEEPTGPFTMTAVYESGLARVAVVADNAFQDDGFELRANAPFMRSLLAWLTEPRPAFDHYVYLPLVVQNHPPPLPPRVWDPRLDELGVTLEPADTGPGEGYWRLLEALWADEQEAAGRHHIFVEVIDAEGDRVVGQPVVFEWSTGSLTLYVEDKPPPEYGVNFPMYNTLGSYDVLVGGGNPTDRMVGLGLGTPEQPGFTIHTCFYLTFQWVPGTGQYAGRFPDGRLLSPDANAASSRR